MVSKIKDHQEPAPSIKEILERSGLSEQLKNIGQINEALNVAFNPIIDQIRETMPQASIIERLKELGVEPYTNPEMEALRNHAATISATWSYSHQILMDSGLREIISAFNQQKIIIDFSFLNFSQLKSAIDWEAFKECPELHGEELEDISDFDEEMTQFMECSYPAEDFRSKESWWQTISTELKITILITIFLAYLNYHQSERHHHEQLEQAEQHHHEQLEASQGDQKELKRNTEALNKHSESLDRNSELLLRQEKSRDIQQTDGQVKQIDRTPPKNQSKASENKPVIVEKPDGD